MPPIAFSAPAWDWTATTPKRWRPLVRLNPSAAITAPRSWRKCDGPDADLGGRLNQGVGRISRPTTRPLRLSVLLRSLRCRSSDGSPVAAVLADMVSYCGWRPAIARRLSISGLVWEERTDPPSAAGRNGLRLMIALDQQCGQDARLRRHVRVRVVHEWRRPETTGVRSAAGSGSRSFCPSPGSGRCRR